MTHVKLLNPEYKIFRPRRSEPDVQRRRLEPDEYVYWNPDAAGVADHVRLSRAQMDGFAAGKPRTRRGAGRSLGGRMVGGRE